MLGWYGMGHLVFNSWSSISLSALEGKCVLDKFSSGSWQVLDNCSFLSDTVNKGSTQTPCRVSRKFKLLHVVSLWIVSVQLECIAGT